MTTPSPWDWAPSDNAWFEQIGPRAARWTPDRWFGVHGLDARALLAEAVARAAPALIHPALAAVTLDAEDHQAQRDLLLVCTLADLDPDAHGEVELFEPCWLWAPDGGFEVPAGRHDLRALRARRGPGPTRIAVDPFGDSIGLSLAAPTSDAALTPLDLAWTPETLPASVSEMMTSLAILQTRLPACAAWVEPVTRVVVLLPPEPTSTHNWSRMDVPGAIYTSAPHGWTDALETVVHESAHRRLFLAEAGAPLCEPSARRFRSPLRPDPRPLRGILLAWHAIAYMAAFYREADLAGLPLDGDAQARWRRLLDQADDCAATLRTAEDDLTEAGLAFCAETQGVVNYARL